MNISATPGEVRRTPAGAWLMLVLLALGFVLSFVDRQILSLLAPAIRADLGLGDVQISLLHGVAFAVFYTALGVPLAALADRGRRISLIVGGMVAWSAATIGCGLAEGFVGLFVCRLLVGVGEATLNPAAYRLIGDGFSERSRALAFGVFHVAGSLGAGLALLAGGLLIASVGQAGPLTAPLVGEIRPWQVIFILCGAPGLILAAVIAAVVRDRSARPLATPGSETAGEGAALGTELFRRWPLLLGSAAFAVFGLGGLAWAPTYFVRTFDWSMAQSGMSLGGVIMTTGVVGPIAGGWWADRRGPGGRESTIFWCALLAAPLGVLAFLAPWPWISLGLYGVAYGLFTAHIGLVPATLDAEAASGVRARLSALWLCVFNVIGLGCGPLLVAVLTERVLGDPDRIGQALSLVAGLALGAAVLLSRLSKTRQGRAGREPLLD